MGKTTTMFENNGGGKKKKKRREVDELELSFEHNKEEVKRLRAYSEDDDDDESPTKRRRRTRSMDEAEAKKAAAKQEEEPEDATSWRKEHNITVRGHGKADQAALAQTDPFFEFEQAPWDDRVQRSLKQAGFDRPTPIQSQAWPIAVQGSDMICIAKTGSGKTLGFLLPAFERHYKEKTATTTTMIKPFMLVLAPTRELSVQILEEAQRFGRPLGIRSVCCYGGASKYPQIAALERGVHCIIATPGRLNDLTEQGKVDLSKIKYFVMDEADRMLDMGFEPQIRQIVQNLPNNDTGNRQTLLFSATWPREIQDLAHDFLVNPVQINVGEVNALVANKDIQQTILVCREDDKHDELIKILSEITEKKDSDTKHVLGTKGRHEKVIVFCSKKITTHDLANQLWEDGFAVDSLHGDRPQWERTRVMNAFKQGQLRMLIATDVAARGLDVKDVSVVINYDFPAGNVNGVEDYVHRIGRTGRAGNKGRAYTFFTQRDKKSAAKLVQVLQRAEQEIPEELERMVPRRRPPRPGGGGGGSRRTSLRGSGGGGGRSYMSGRGYMNGRGGGYSNGRNGRYGGGRNGFGGGGGGRGGRGRGGGRGGRGRGGLGF